MDTGTATRLISVRWAGMRRDNHVYSITLDVGRGSIDV